jgi:hypothetical protein
MGAFLWRNHPINDGTAICHKYVTDRSFFRQLLCRDCVPNFMIACPAEKEPEGDRIVGRNRFSGKLAESQPFG